MIKPCFLISAFCLLQLHASYGQYDAGATMMIAQNNMLYNNTIQSFVNQNIINDLAYGNAAKGSSKTVKPTTAAPADAKSFLISPNSRVTAEVKQAIIDNLKGKNPASGKNLENALRQYDPFPSYISLLKTLGLDVQHSYADAFTAYMLGMWRIANGMGDNPSLFQINAVRKQVNSTIHLEDRNNRQKQEAVDYMIYELIFANEPYEGSHKARDTRQMKLDSDAVYHRFLKNNHMDLRKMYITENGLTTRDD